MYYISLFYLLWLITLFIEKIIAYYEIELHILKILEYKLLGISSSIS